MSAEELRASLGLAGVLSLRMLGLFIILPVFALYAVDLPSTPNHTLVGIAMGAYGLAQACLQIPFGALSDRWGRKRTIYLGLAVFAVGSLVAGLAQDIYMVILGRTIQGAGAISAAVLALTADLTRDEQRTKAMALIGMSIGVTFAISIVGGAVLARSVGVPGIFLLTGLLGLVAMAVVRWVVPEPQATAPLNAQPKTPLGQLLRQPDLARINFGIFVLQAVLMAMWVVVPFDMREAGLQARNHWLVYLPVLVGSVVLMLPPMLLAERRGKQKVALLGGIAVLILSEAALALGRHSLWGIGVALLLFFAAFNLLEASLPALISRTAPPESKGTAIGIYSSVQFLGTFTGGVAGGFVSQHFGGTAVFTLCGIAALSWLMIAARMRLPGAVRMHTYPVPQMDETRAQGLSHRLARLPGVREARVRAAEGVALLKVDSARFEENNVLKLLSGEV